jgi:ABC-type sugar transport system ATPase subunit
MMKGIVFEKICKSYGDNQVVENLDLVVNAGERLILLGPSGCGKTTTLRMIAGLEDITSGILRMGGQIANDLEPGQRNVAMVFQNYALYPHMTVWENITFGLSLQRMPKAEIKTRADNALQILNLTGYEQRKPKELSGGQKQRVALGRALVKQAPYFLLDEPLSNLDAQLRLQARTELVKIHNIYQPTLIYVTHDQVEALTVGQRIAIMNQGVLQQIDTPDVIYQHPANTFVASFIGSPPMNLIASQFHDGALWIADSRIAVPVEWQALLASHGKLKIGIRPEHCQVSDKQLLSGRIILIEHLGSQNCLHVQLSDGQKLLCMLSAEQPLPSGTVKFTFTWDHFNGFADRDGTNIGHPDENSLSLSC